MNKPVATIWWGWLLAAVGLIELVGIGMLWPNWPAQQFFHWLLFPAPPQFEGVAGSYINMLYAVLGAVMIGWAITLAGIVLVPFRRGEAWAWLTVVGAASAWFVIDSGLSIALGYPLNAVSNCGFALSFAIPLGATYRTFFPAGKPLATGLRQVLSAQD